MKVYETPALLKFMAAGPAKAATLATFAKPNAMPPRLGSARAAAPAPAPAAAPSPAPSVDAAVALACAVETLFQMSRLAGLSSPADMKPGQVGAFQLAAAVVERNPSCSSASALAGAGAALSSFGLLPRP